MSKKLIDNIFDYDSYRYVPQELKAEWKTLYNLYIGNYFKKQHEIWNLVSSFASFANAPTWRAHGLDKRRSKKQQPKYSSCCECEKSNATK